TCSRRSRSIDRRHPVVPTTEVHSLPSRTTEENPMRVPTVIAASFLVSLTSLPTARSDDGLPEKAADRHWLWSTACAVPAEPTSEQSGYSSIVGGQDKHIYIGTAKYGANSYLVDFAPATRRMKVVVDAQKEIGTTATGFAAQSKIHTRNNVGASGRIY